MSVVYLDREAFIAKYADNNPATMDDLRINLQRLQETYTPVGWALMDCQMMDSSKYGMLWVLTFGPNNTWKTIPEWPISPSGAASDMSVVVAVCLVESKVDSAS